MRVRGLLLILLVSLFALPLYYAGVGCGGGDGGEDPLFNISDNGDFDGDGILNINDPDDDDDGILDVNDIFPFESDESADLDSDGIGNNEDTDVDGDGVDNTTDCNDLNSSVNPSAEDKPDGGNIDANCDGIDGEQTKAIWVSESEGLDTNTGTITEPVKTIAKGIELATAKPEGSRDIYIVDGTYLEDVLIGNSVSLYGGYSKLTGSNRTRDLAQFKAAIPGIDGDKKQALPGFGMSIDSTIIIADSQSTTIAGLKTTGDPDGATIVSFNSNATILNCEINESIPTISRENVIGIVASSYSTTYAEHTVVISNNQINMKGNFASTSDEKDFGVLGLPDKGSETLINVVVDGNTFNSEGIADILTAIYVSDNDDDPSDPFATDTKGEATLLAKNNVININGTYNLAVGIIGGMFVDGTLLADKYLHIKEFEAMNNVITINGADSAYGITSGMARISSTIANNVIAVRDAKGGAAPFATLMSPTNIYNNTVHIEDAKNIIGIYSVSYPDDFPGYASVAPKNVINNIFDLHAGPLCGGYVGVIEGVDSTDNNNTHLASFLEVKNNNFYIAPNGCPVNIYYSDLTQANPSTNNKVLSIGDLNNKTGFAVNDPTIFSGNIADSPLFIDAASGNFQLQDSSTLIDAGLDFETGFTDILGNARPIGASFDIGAFER